VRKVDLVSVFDQPLSSPENVDLTLQALSSSSKVFLYVLNVKAIEMGGLSE